MTVKIYAVTSIKGGTGKTATAGALAMAAQHDGRRVLAIDMDPQAALSIWFKAQLQKGTPELFSGADINDVIQGGIFGIDVIAARSDLISVKTAPGSAGRLKAQLQQIKNKYDFIVIDTAPNMGELQNNALIACDRAIIPLLADGFAIQALYQAVSIAKINNAKIGGILITRYDKRPKFCRFIADAMRAKCAEMRIPYLGEIRQGIAMQEAAGLNRDLFEYAGKSKPAEDYAAVYGKIKNGGIRNAG